MREDIIRFIQNEVKQRCESESNFFGIGCYYHICAVVENAVFLAEKYGGDVEAVTIAAWLHPGFWSFPLLFLKKEIPLQKVYFLEREKFFSSLL